MPPDLSVVVAPLLSESFGPTGELPTGPNPDVRMFIDDRRAIPVSTGVIETVDKSGMLVDCPGGLLVVHEVAAKGQDYRLTQTWSVLCFLVAPSGKVTLRAFKGSLFNKLASSARVDLVVQSGAPGSQWRLGRVLERAQEAAVAKWRPLHCSNSELISERIPLR